MAEYSRDQYVGLLIPEYKIVPGNEDSATANYTQSTPRPGIPVAQQDTEMVLKATGTQSAAMSLETIAQKGGMPGLGDSAAGHAWRQDGDTLWRGHDVPQAMFGIESPNYNALAGSRAQRGARFPHGVKLSDDSLVVAYCNNDATNSTVGVYTYSAARVWTAVGTVHTETSDGTHELHPCMCVLPSGDVLLFYWTYDATANLGQVQMRYSSDSGATWTVGATYSLPAPVDTSTYTVEGMRVAYNGGDILLLVTLSGTNEYRQYASDSLGNSFSLVETTTLSGVGGNNDVAPIPGGGFLLSDNEADVVSGSFCLALGSAFQPASTGVASIPPAAFSGIDGIQFAIDDNGTIYAYGLNDASEVISVAESIDGGESWTTLGDQYSWPSALATQTSGHYPDRYHAVFQRGRVLLLHNFESTGGTLGGDYDNSLMVAYLGGYSDLTMPPQTKLDTASLRGHWLYDWVPYNLPGDMVWTAAGSATTEALTSASNVPYLDITTTAGNARTYTVNDNTGTPTLAKGMGCTFIASSQDVTGSYPAVQLEIDDASDEFQVEVRLNGTSLILYDVNGAAALATKTIVSDTYYQVHVWLKSDDGVTGEVYAWYRAWDTNEDREWTELGNSAAVTRAAGGVQTFACVWGHIAAGAAQSEWIQVSFVNGSETGESLADGVTNPDDLALRRISSRPTYIDDGVKLSATDGPARGGHEWATATRYDYPIANIYPHLSPSPARPWKGTVTTDTYFAWNLEDIAGEAIDWPSDILGIYLNECNATVIDIHTKANPAAGWSSLASNFTMRELVAFTRSGKSVELTKDASGPSFYIAEDELAGCDFSFATAAITRKIVHNTAGWVGSSTTHKPRLFFDTVDGTEGASGTGSIFYRRALLVVSLEGAQAAAVRITFKLSGAPAPTEGYWEAGNIVIGSIYPLGTSPSYTRSVATDANVTISEAPDWTDRARSRGEPRRVYDLSWTEGVDERPLFLGSDDYVVASDQASAEPVALKRDTARVVEALYRHRLNGPKTPIVMIPRLPHQGAGAAAADYVTREANGAVLVRMEDGVTRQTLLGDEDSAEVIRFGLKLREVK